MELLVGLFAGKEFISILIFCCDATDKVNNDTIRKEAIFLNIVQSKSFLMRWAQDFSKTCLPPIRSASPDSYRDAKQ
jgi:hypothetical protein